MGKIKFIMKYVINDYVKKKSEHPHISVTPEFDYRDYFNFVSSTLHQHRETEPMFNELNDKLYDFYYELIQEAIKNKELRDDIDVKTLVIYIQTVLKGFIGLWVYQPNLTIEEITEANAKMIWEAIKPQ